MVFKDRWKWLEKGRWGLEISSHVRKELLEPPGEAPRHPCLLLASGIGADWINKLGMTVNLDPRFLARHIGSTGTYVGGSTELDNLSFDFSTFLRSKRHKDQPGAVPARNSQSFHIARRSLQAFRKQDSNSCYDQSGQQNAHFSRDDADTDRVSEIGPVAFLCHRISLFQVSAHGCE